MISCCCLWLNYRKVLFFNWSLIKIFLTQWTWFYYLLFSFESTANFSLKWDTYLLRHIFTDTQVLTHMLHSLSQQKCQGNWVVSSNLSISISSSRAASPCKLREAQRCTPNHSMAASQKKSRKAEKKYWKTWRLKKSWPWVWCSLTGESSWAGQGRNLGYVLIVYLDCVLTLY